MAQSLNEIRRLKDQSMVNTVLTENHEAGFARSPRVHTIKTFAGAAVMSTAALAVLGGLATHLFLLAENAIIPIELVGSVVAAVIATAWAERGKH